MRSIQQSGAVMASKFASGLGGAGAGEANCGIEGIGSAMGNASGKADTAPTRLRSGLASVSTQMQRLQSLWVAFQGLQLFGAGIKGMVGPIPAHAGPPGPA